MAESPSTLRDDELNAFVEESRRVIAGARVETKRGAGLLPARSEAESPAIDLRTVAAGVITFSELGDYQLARALSSFLLAVQGPDGAWAERYEQDGTQSDSPTAQDVTALVVWALMRYVRASSDEAFAEQARQHVEEAASYTRAQTLNPYLYLIETTSSLHGPNVSAGYDLWSSCAHAAAFALCHRVYGGERYRRLALLIRRSIGLLMTSEGRFVRRLDPSGNLDGRPDVCLIAPDYFGLWPATERIVMNSADLIERTLWNVEIGGYIRFLPYSRVERSGPFGPSPCFTAWMAQYHYGLGNKDRAEAILRWLMDNAVDGQLADVLVPSASALRYLPEQRRAAAEVTEGDGAGRQKLLRELDTIGERAAEQSVTPLGAPSTRAHLETLRALRRGGYLDAWQAESEASRLGDEDPVRE